MSDSYPYLALARRMGVSYGYVLWYATYVEQNYKIVSNLGGSWFATAAQRLTEKQKQCVMSTVRAEWQRRRETTT